MLEDRDLLSEDIASAKNWVRRRYGTHSDYEELVQEAGIALWQAWEKGESRAYAFQSMKWRVLNLITPDGAARFLGAPRLEAGIAFQARGAATRDKVRQYVIEYRRLHGVTPSTYRIAQGTGLGEGPINNALRHLWVKSATEAPRTPPTTRWMEESDLDGWEDASKSKFLVEVGKATATPPREPEVLDRVLLSQILAKTDLTDVQKEILKEVYWDDRRQVDVARALNIPQSTIQKWHNDAMAKLKETAESLGVSA